MHDYEKNCNFATQIEKWSIIRSVLIDDLHTDGLFCKNRMWIRTAERKYYSALRSSARAVQIDKYNLMGDPTYYVFGMDNYGNIAPFHAPYVDRKSIDEESIESIKLYNIYGQLLGEYKSFGFSVDGDRSIKIIEITYKNGETKIYKVL